MNTYYNKIYGLAVAVAAGFTMVACSDVLDEMPDNRTDIDTPKKVAQLMASAYPGGSPALIEELLADNIVDNNVEVAGCHKSAYQMYQQEIFQWEDIVTYTTGNDDTPYQVWEEFYHSIATCNHALRAIREIVAADPSKEAQLNASKGEALVVRAWMHFQLCNLFALQYKNEKQTDPGIPYTTTVEEEDFMNYQDSILTVPEIYAKVEKDLLAGIDLLDDGTYQVVSYHMNINAANALAARFYLYKRDWKKAEEYASKALGGNPANMLRVWSVTADFATSDERKNWYNNPNAGCNFLIQPVYSTYDRMLTSGARHCFNGQSDSGKETGKFQSYNPPCGVTIRTPGPNWSNINGPQCFRNGGFYISSQGQQYGVFFASMLEYFEYSDKIAGIGFVHMLRHPFWADETLLVRAEARFYQGNESGCLEDLQLWTTSHLEPAALTQTKIDAFYNESRKGYWWHEFDLEAAGWDKPEDIARTKANKSLIDCILHFRRIETLYEGLRWEDIKRYGITVHHRWRGIHELEVTKDSLVANDPRRAVKYPNLVRASGLNVQQNPVLGEVPTASSK